MQQPDQKSMLCAFHASACMVVVWARKACAAKFPTQGPMQSGLMVAGLKIILPTDACRSPRTIEDCYIE